MTAASTTAAATAAARSLRAHFVGTYSALRIALVVVAGLLPLTLLVHSLIDGSPLRGSMSAYYYSGARDLFVGGLFVVSGLLIAYQGYSQRENHVLDAAGAALILVAVFPTEDPAARAAQVEAPGALGFLSVHGAAAVVFFLCIAYVCWFRARDTLPLVSGNATFGRKQYRALYKSVGIALALSPLAAIVVAFLTRASDTQPSFIFWIEAFGVWTFGVYWALKTMELRRSDAEALAAAGRLTDPPGEGGPVTVIEPDLEEALDPDGLTPEQAAQVQAYVLGTGEG